MLVPRGNDELGTESIKYRILGTVTVSGLGRIVEIYKAKIGWVYHFRQAYKNHPKEHWEYRVIREIREPEV